MLIQTLNSSWLQPWLYEKSDYSECRRVFVKFLVRIMHALDFNIKLLLIPYVMLGIKGQYQRSSDEMIS